jgi:hypothetical protein
MKEEGMDEQVSMRRDSCEEEEGEEEEEELTSCANRVREV